MLWIVGIICIIVGAIFKTFPPRKINSIYGYRTSSAMKNQETWNEAQRYSSNTFIILGLVYVALEFALSRFAQNISNNITYEGIILLIGVVITIVITEVHLKNFCK